MMWRLNFLVAVTCLVLQNHYMLYYICPMHTLFTIFVYATLALGQKYNAHTAGIMVKCALPRSFPPFHACHTRPRTAEVPGCCVQLSALPTCVLCMRCTPHLLHGAGHPRKCTDARQQCCKLCSMRGRLVGCPPGCLQSCDGLRALRRIGLCFALVYLCWDLKPVFYAIWSPFTFIMGYSDPRKPTNDLLHGAAPCSASCYAQQHSTVKAVPGQTCTPGSVLLA